LKRDIYREVAAIKNGLDTIDVTDNMVDKIKEVDDKNSYSIEGDAITNWDEYFYNVSITVGRNSKCLSRRIGAVLVEDKSIISTGYNGPPRGIPTCDMRWQIDSVFREKYKDVDFSKKICPRKSIGFKSGQGLEICVAGHAERNALINAARNGIKTKGTTLYMSCGVPCSACLVEIINAGVVEIVVTSMRTYDESAMYLLENSDLKIRLYDFL
jgi:dCMP deaminase